MTAPAGSGRPGHSRLDRMIARLRSQRACLTFAAREIAGVPGPVLELGLGKGRTYDHLHRLLPDREIWVFDRDVHAPADCIPPASRLVLGELRETLPAILARLDAGPALVHADIGSENRARDAALAADLSRILGPVLAPGGLVLADRAMNWPGWRSLPLPDDAEGWEYFIYHAS